MRPLHSCADLAPGIQPSMQRCGSRDTLPWYCIHTYPGKEFLAAAHLRHQRFRTFFPTLDVGQKNRKGTTLRPFLPGYLFVSFDLDRDFWQSIYFTHGVKALFSSTPESPTPVPQRAIRTLIAQTIWERTGEPAQPALIHPGCKVRVVRGPLRGFVGDTCVTALDDETRKAIVKMGLFGRDSEVEFYLDDLAPA